MTKYYGNIKIENLVDGIKTLRQSPMFSEITEEVDMFMDALQTKAEQLQQENEQLKNAKEIMAYRENTFVNWKEKYNDLLQRAREIYEKLYEYGGIGNYDRITLLEELFGEENLTPK